ncbi:hypothetical protein, partial [Ornithinimicrobium sediminis]|uniref:hypothetical protein n=1 Tax=Ornithinimicrobium sediminis TaxID=2904603 RepID=UPI001E4D2B6E
YNIEMNVPPRPMAGDQAVRLERWLSKSLRDAGDRHGCGASRTGRPGPLAPSRAQGPGRARPVAPRGQAWVLRRRE